MDYAVVTRKLRKSFSGREVIAGCDMRVERGRIYGLLGRNGAGKTTVFKLLLGLMRPTAGTAEVLGLDSVRDRKEVLRRTGSLIGVPVFYEHLSAAENLRIHLAYMGLPGEGTEEALKAAGLFGTGTQPVSEFSLGMCQRLAVARAVVHRPEVVILDEPVNGLDPVAMREMRLFFRRLADDEGVTILMSTHLLAEAEQVADRIGVIEKGHIVAEEDTETVRKNGSGGAEEWFLALSMCINFAGIVLSLLGMLTPTTGALVHNAGSCFVVLIAALLYDRKLT